MTMFNTPKTLAEAREHKYGHSSSYAHKVPYVEGRCAYEVSDYSTRWPMYHQCYRKNGHGPESLYCLVHAKMVEPEKYPAKPRKKSLVEQLIDHNAELKKEVTRLKTEVTILKKKLEGAGL